MGYLDYDIDFINLKKKEYNGIPIFYCKRCLSLKINGEIEDNEYCENCNNTDIGQCSIEEWELMFFKKYKYNFLEGDTRKNIK